VIEAGRRSVNISLEYRGVGEFVEVLTEHLGSERTSSVVSLISERKRAIQSLKQS